MKLSTGTLARNNEPNLDASAPAPTESKPRAKRSRRRRGDVYFAIRLRRFSEKRVLCWAVLALAMIVGRIALLPVDPYPIPKYQDEFSYILSADTFAHGRMTNPSPADPGAFETMHELVRPVYVSKFPPGQSLMLAIGEKLGGHPYWGVVLETALMIFLFCWMADVWLPPQWVLIGGALGVVFFFVRHYWFESYWGGSLTACGGALVVGAVGGVLRGRLSRARLAALGLGASVLFMTRPFEGGALCLAAGVVLLLHLRRSTPEFRRQFLRRALPANAAILLATVAFTGWYNYRVTGHVTQMPYQLYMQQYDEFSPLWVLPEVPRKHYVNANIRDQEYWMWQWYEQIHHLPFFEGLLRQCTLFLARGVLANFLGFGFLLLALPWARMGGRKKWALVLLSGGVGATVVDSGVMTHYSAPIAPVLLLLIVACARTVWYRLGRVKWGALAFAPMALILVLLTLVDYHNFFGNLHSTDRANLIQKLEAMGGNHLVFVDYAKGWHGWAPSRAWVYNPTDVTKGPVIFANMRSEKENRRLMEQYPGWTDWIVKLGPKKSALHVENYDTKLALDIPRELTRGGSPR